MSKLLDHPSYVIAFVNAVLIAAISFGVDLTDAQFASIMGLANATMVLLLVVKDKAVPNETSN